MIGRRYSPSALRALLSRPNSEFLAADDGTAICGAAYAEVSGDVATLRLLHVRPAMQGRGVGGLLLDEIEGSFPQANRLRLEIDEGNAKAVAFCVGQGFTRVGTTDGDGTADAGFATARYERPIHWAQ